MPETSILRSALGRIALVCALALGMAPSGRLAAQPVAQPVAQPEASDVQLLEDFNFYVNIANLELAKANADALLARGLNPGRFLGMVEDSPSLQERFDRAYRRALVVPELEDVASRLYRLYEDGRLARARDPKEIAANIALLTGSPRGQILARQRLASAGEYAVPQLLEVLLNRPGLPLQTEVQQLLVSMGRQSVSPLCAAILGVDAATQETLARILGRIGYRSALPFVAELYRSTTAAPVRAAAEAAIRALGGVPDPAMPVGPLYVELAEQYYSQPKSLTSFPGEANQLLWSFDPALGLNPTAILTEVFHQARAMGLAERALRLDPKDQDSIALWLAANFSRQLAQPADYENPAYPAGERRDPMYYAVAAGAGTTQRVLDRALKNRDTRLARKAIEALSRSAGGSGLSGAGGQGRALVEALSYPDRRVRFEAALALGRANPGQPFAGSERVVPILASVIREAAKRFAVVVAVEPERQQEIRKVLEGLGYQVLPPGTSLSQVADPIASVPGVDLLVCDLTTETTRETIDQARRTARLQATPILALLSVTGLAQQAAQFEGDELTRLARQGISSEQLSASVEQLVERASGKAVTEKEAGDYAMAALGVLHDLAISSGGGSAGAAFDVADAAVPLMSALTETSGEVRMRVADVLSYISQQRVQTALMDAVMNSGGAERLKLMARMIDSAKRFGNLLQERQVKWLVGTAEGRNEEEATTAAALMGALNLPNEKLVPLILGGGGAGR